MAEELSRKQVMDDAADCWFASEVLDDMLLRVTVNEVYEAMGKVAKRTREEAAKRVGECERCKADEAGGYKGGWKDAEIARLNKIMFECDENYMCFHCRQLVPIADGPSHWATCDKHPAKAALAEAQKELAELNRENSHMTGCCERLAEAQAKLASESRQTEMMRAIHAAAEEKLAEAQAKAVQPGELMIDGYIYKRIEV